MNERHVAPALAMFMSRRMGDYEARRPHLIETHALTQMSGFPHEFVAH